MSACGRAHAPLLRPTPAGCSNSTRRQDCVVAQVPRRQGQEGRADCGASPTLTAVSVWEAAEAATAAAAAAAEMTAAARPMACERCHGWRAGGQLEPQPCHAAAQHRSGCCRSSSRMRPAGTSVACRAQLPTDCPARCPLPLPPPQVVESDKADMDVESFAEGILGAIVVPEGGVANVSRLAASSTRLARLGWRRSMRAGRLAAALALPLTIRLPSGSCLISAPPPPSAAGGRRDCVCGRDRR